MHSLTRTQVLGVLAAAKAGRDRDWLMVAVGFNHGLRPSEVVHLTGDSVRDGYLDVRRLKGSLHTVQPLVRDPNPLLDEDQALIDYAAKCGPNQRLFPITRQHFGRLFVRYCRTAGIPRHLAHPHVLKHSIAMQTIEKAGIENVRQYLGHKSMSSTGAYLKVGDEAAALAVSKARRFEKV